MMCSGMLKYRQFAIKKIVTCMGSVFDSMGMCMYAIITF